MIQIRYETSAEKCIRLNTKTYQHKPRFLRARAAKKINSARFYESNDVAMKDIIRCAELEASAI